MVIRKIATIIAIIGTVLVNNLVVKSQTLKNNDTIPTFTVCHLNENSSKYDGKTVRIIGTYAANFERLTIYDSSCKKVEKSVEFLPDCKTTCDCKQFNNQLYEHIKGNPLDGLFVNVVVVGIVEVRNLPKESNEHNIVIHVQSIEKTSPVDN